MSFVWNVDSLGAMWGFVNPKSIKILSVLPNPLRHCWFTYLFTHLFKIYLLSSYCVPGTVCSSGFQSVLSTLGSEQMCPLGACLTTSDTKPSERWFHQKESSLLGYFSASAVLLHSWEHPGASVCFAACSVLALVSRLLTPGSQGDYCRFVTWRLQCLIWKNMNLVKVEKDCFRNPLAEAQFHFPSCIILLVPKSVGGQMDNMAGLHQPFSKCALGTVRSP